MNVYEEFLKDVKTRQDALESIKLKYQKKAQMEEDEQAYNERVTKAKRVESQKNDIKLKRTDYKLPKIDDTPRNENS